MRVKFPVTQALFARLLTQFVPQALPLVGLEPRLRPDSTGQHERRPGDGKRQTGVGPTGAPSFPKKTPGCLERPRRPRTGKQAHPGSAGALDRAGMIDAHGSHSRHPEKRSLTRGGKPCNRQ